MAAESGSTVYTLQDLLVLMKRLRDPVSGCPWDIKQSYASITPSTLEEAYEVVDAIERQDYDHLKEELGDLVFQAIFYSQIAKEEGRFDFSEVISTLVEKLIRRHPHVFPDGNLYQVVKPLDLKEELDVKQQWEEIKKEERALQGKQGVLADVPLSLPALTRAQKLQKRASQVGFDWPNVEGVVNKVQEELQELSQAASSADISAIEEELGDLLFTCVNLSRHLKVDAESALRRANTKFLQRFQSIEKACVDSGVDIAALGDEELDRLWRLAKERELEKRNKKL